MPMQAQHPSATPRVSVLHLECTPPSSSTQSFAPSELHRSLREYVTSHARSPQVDWRTRPAHTPLPAPCHRKPAPEVPASSPAPPTPADETSKPRTQPAQQNRLSNPNALRATAHAAAPPFFDPHPSSK